LGYQFALSQFRCIAHIATLTYTTWRELKNNLKDMWKIVKVSFFFLSLIYFTSYFLFDIMLIQICFGVVKV